jgi:hypothetical protein
MFHIVDQSFLNAFILYKSAMLGRGLKPMSHLLFCVSVVYALVKVQRSMRTCMPKARVRNPSKIHYSMAWSGHEKRKRRKCVICQKIRQ